MENQKGKTCTTKDNTSFEAAINIVKGKVITVSGLGGP
jgi:hypothetical protein